MITPTERKSVQKSIKLKESTYFAIKGICSATNRKFNDVVGELLDFALERQGDNKKSGFLSKFLKR